MATSTGSFGLSGFLSLSASDFTARSLQDKPIRASRANYGPCFYGLAKGRRCAILPAMNLQPEQVPQAIRDLHNAYERLTGAQLTLNWQRLDQWRVFMAYRQPPFTCDELRIVVAHIRKGVSDNRRNMGALKFHNLIGQPDYFEEDLNEARAMARPKPPDTKAVTYHNTQRIMPDANTGNTAVPLADVIKAMREAVNSQ